MIHKYPHIFEKMFDKIFIKQEPSLDVIKEHMPTFEKEGIGLIGIYHYIGEYIKYLKKK